MDKVNLAAIDLGTNTFHLVIFQKEGELIREIYRKRHHVFLSENGIETIGNSSIDRAKDAIVDFKQALSIYEPNLRIIGTEAIRIASNGNELKKWIEHQLNTPVEIITGDREAELIAKGVMWEWNEQIENALIMDIGGGSVEFIHIKSGNILWKDSFPVGVGVLHNYSNHSEPINETDKKAITLFIESRCTTLVQYLNSNTFSKVIGCSGSFELIPSILQGQYPALIDQTEIKIADFHKVKERVFSSDLEKRYQIAGLPKVRAELIVVAFVLMEWTLSQLSIENLHISKYAVKEGLISEELYNF